MKSYKTCVGILVKKNLVGLLLLTSIVSTPSCLQVSNLPLPEGETQIVVNALFQPDSSWKIHLSLTGSTASDDAYFLPNVSDATVEVREAGGEWRQFDYQGNGNYGDDSQPQTGKSYEFRAWIEGEDTLRARSSIPAFPSDMEASWDLSQGIPLTDQWGGTFDGFRIPISFSDPPGEQNAYQFSMVYHDSCICPATSSTLAEVYPEGVYIDPLYDRLKLFAIENAPLPTVSYEDSRRVLLPDASFDGLPTRLELFSADTNTLFRRSMQIPLQQSPPDSVQNFETLFVRHRLYIRAYLDAWSLSEDLFQYLSSYYLQGVNTADPFATFNNVHSNIEGGLGIFAGYQRRLILIYSD